VGSFDCPQYNPQLAASVIVKAAATFPKFIFNNIYKNNEGNIKPQADQLL
jgi:hypothetical protein